jgi:Holliday junction resolvase RusA-like endonuclease
MTIDIEIFQTLLKMPDSLKKEILHYEELILENYRLTFIQLLKDYSKKESLKYRIKLSVT